jgi:hypothetical protein
MSNFINGAAKYFVPAFQIINFCFTVLKKQNGRSLNQFQKQPCFEIGFTQNIAWFLKKFLPLFEQSTEPGLKQRTQGSVCAGEALYILRSKSHQTILAVFQCSVNDMPPALVFFPHKK